jgi:signal transduction histidine kinase
MRVAIQVKARSARAERQTRLAGLGQSALKGAPLDVLMRDAAALAASGLGVEQAQVLERVPDGALVPRAGHGWKPGAARDGGDERQASHAAFTLQAGGPVVLADLAKETRFPPSHRLRAHGVRSGLAVPVAGRESGAAFGVLAVYSSRLRSYGSEDVSFLETLAYLLAAAVIDRREAGLRRLLLQRVMSAQEDERRRLARELHDETGQVLTSLLVGLRTIEDAPSQDLVRVRASRLTAITAEAIASVGRLSRGLHPSVLQDLGLGPALSRHASDHSEALGIRISVDERLGSRRLPPEVETSLFRIAQEAITNIGKHSGASQAWICLRRTQRAVTLEVKDDGRGFLVEDALSLAIGSGRLGLQGMRERAAFLGGEAQVDSRPGAGTRIQVRIPLTGTTGDTP